MASSAKVAHDPIHHSSSDGAGASAKWALLDEVSPHRLRRAALHLPQRRSEHGPC